MCININSNNKNRKDHALIEVSKKQAINLKF